MAVNGSVARCEGVTGETRGRRPGGFRYTTSSVSVDVSYLWN